MMFRIEYILEMQGQKVSVAGNEDFNECNEENAICIWKAFKSECKEATGFLSKFVRIEPCRLMKINQQEVDVLIETI